MEGVLLRMLLIYISKSSKKGKTVTVTLWIRPHVNAVFMQAGGRPVQRTVSLFLALPNPKYV